MKQVTRYVGRDSNIWYSFWHKKPTKFVKGTGWVGKDGEDADDSDDGLEIVCSCALEAIAPNLKMKAGRLKKVRTIAEDVK